MAVREGMDVRIATDQAGRRRFVTQPERATASLAASGEDVLGGDAVLEPARGISRIVAGGQPDPRLPITGIDDSGTNRDERSAGSRIGEGQQWRQRAVPLPDG